MILFYTEIYFYTSTVSQIFHSINLHQDDQIGKKTKEDDKNDNRIQYQSM